MKTITIKVTQHHITTARKFKRRSIYIPALCCPIARAINAQKPFKLERGDIVRVGRHRIQVSRPDGSHNGTFNRITIAELPVVATAFTVAFDSGSKLARPFSFQLKVRNSLAHRYENHHSYSH